VEETKKALDDGRFEQDFAFDLGGGPDLPAILPGAARQISPIARHVIQLVIHPRLLTA